MRNTRNKRRLAEIQDNFEENNSRGSSRERSQIDLNENYITQVSQEIEGRIAKKLSQEFAKRENRILGALAKLDNFLCKPQDTKDASTPKQKITSVTGNFEAQSQIRLIEKSTFSQVGVTHIIFQTQRRPSTW